MARHRSHDEWCELINEYERSELRQQDFAETHGLSLSSFKKWLYRLRRERTRELPMQSGFVDLSGDEGSGTIVIRNPPCRLSIGGAVIEFPEAPAPAWMAEFLAQCPGIRC